MTILTYSALTVGLSALAYATAANAEVPGDGWQARTYATETALHRACLIEMGRRDAKKEAARAVLLGDTRVYAQLAEENTIYDAPGLTSCRPRKNIRNEIIEKFAGFGGEPSSYRACGGAMMQYMETYNRFLHAKMGSRVCR